MKEISKEQFEQEIKLFEGFCNKINNDLDEYINLNKDDEVASLKFKKRKCEFERFINFILEETQFITAPASTKFHLCIKHGTLIHSNSVAKTILKLNNALDSKIPIYKLLTTALFHDLGKAGNPGEDLYLINEPTEKQKQYGYAASVPYRYNEDIFYNEHEDRSLFYITKFMEIDQDEYVAIRHHNEPWNGITQSLFKQCKLMTLLQYADYYSCVYLEERK